MTKFVEHIVEKESYHDKGKSKKLLMRELKALREKNLMLENADKLADTWAEFVLQIGLKLAVSGVESKAVVESCKAISATLDDKDPTRLLGGETLIAQERLRQIEEEGHTQEHDATHNFGELALVAAYYVLHDLPEMQDQANAVRGMLEDLGATGGDWLKPKDHLRNLVRAGALIAAEIDRVLMDREIRQATRR